MNKSETIKYFGNLYLNENMTAEQIAEETGYGLSTVKHYLAKGQYRKNTYYSNEELDGIRKPKDKIIKKNGKSYQTLSREQMIKIFNRDHKK